MLTMVVSEASRVGGSSSSHHEVRIPSEAELMEDEVQDSNGPFTCPYPNCTATCRRKCALALHIHKVHRSGATEKRKEIVYHCPVEGCRYAATHPEGRYFDTLKHVKQHFGKMHLDKRHVCERCNKRFALKGDCERHVRQCGEQFACDDCGVQYGARGSLFTHCLRNGHLLPARYQFFAKRAPAAGRTSKALPVLTPEGGRTPKLPLARQRAQPRSDVSDTASASVLLLVPVSAVQSAIQSLTPMHNNVHSFRPIQCGSKRALASKASDDSRLCNSNTQTSESYISCKQSRVVHDIAVSTFAANQLNRTPQTAAFTLPTATRASQTNESEELDAIIASLVRSCETQTHSSFIQNQQCFAAFGEDTSEPLLCSLVEEAPIKLRCSTIQTESGLRSALHCMEDGAPNAHTGVQTVDTAFEQDFTSCATQTAAQTAFDDDDDELLRWFDSPAKLDSLAAALSHSEQPPRFVRESEAQTTLQRGTRERNLATPPCTCASLERCFSTLPTPEPHNMLVQMSTSVGETQTLFEYFDLLDTGTQTDRL